MADAETICKQQDMVTELDELMEEYEEKFKGDMTATSTLINYAIKLLMFKYDPLITSEVVSSSLSAWMQYARHRAEELDEDVEMNVVYTTDEEIDPELLFLDTEDLKPN